MIKDQIPKSEDWKEVLKKIGEEMEEKEQQKQMGHHGSDAFDPEYYKDQKFMEKAKLQSFLNEKQIPPTSQLKDLLGATGKFPDGKITNDDEGEIIFGIATHEGRLILNFGKSIQWIGLTKEQGKNIAESILKHIEKL